MVRAPLNSPDEPSPATVRPAINMEEELARPQIKDPASNRIKKKMYVHLFCR